MTRALLSISGVLWVVIPVVCAVGWVSFLWRKSRGQTPLPYESREPVPWGLVDLVLIFLVAVIIQGVSASMLAKPSSAIVVGIVAGASAGGVPEFNLARMSVFSISTLATWAVSLVLVHLRSGATLRDLGLTVSSRDLRVGCIAFAMLIVPVFFLQFLLQQYVSESKHPLIDLLLASPNNMFFLVAGFAAVIVAPIVEEFLFRVYLQGWLEKLAFLQQVRWSTTWQSPETPRRVSRGESYEADDAPYRSVLSTDNMDEMSGDTSTFDALEMRPAWWPIVCSSLLFAAAHLGHGPDPIPLFFLALGLGYLYQRTHRIWPSITVHCLVNLTSLYQLWVYVQVQQA